MRRLATAVFSALALLLGTLAMAGTIDRFVMDFGNADGGITTPAIDSTRVVGQTQFFPVDATCSGGTCTRAAPSSADTNGALEGLSLGDVSAFKAEACVSTGTFSGAGTAEVWLYDPNLPSTIERFAYVIGKDMSFSGAASKKCVTWPNEVNTLRPAGWRIVIRLNGVTVSTSAPTIRVKVSACLKQGCGF